MEIDEDGETLAPGETTLVDGFRRVSPAPQPLALARLRELLLEAASAGATLSRAGLEGFGSWRFVATLCGTEWARGSRRSSLAALRILRRRLQALGARPTSFEAAAALPAGSPVHLTGIIRPLRPGRAKSHIWLHREVNSHNVRLAVEEGHDFLLMGDEDRTARVIAARGHLINADRLEAGQRVSVFGAVDRVLASASVERGGRDLAVRAGDDAPLLVRLVGADLKARDENADRTL